MFIKSIKTILAAGIVATGAAVATVTTTTTANAGSNFSLFIGNGHGGGVHYKKRHKSQKHYRRGHGYKRNGYSQRGRGCGPRRALNTAYRVGVNRPHVARINNKRIVVVGYNRGHPAKVVFKRSGHGCKIIKARGLR